MTHIPDSCTPAHADTVKPHLNAEPGPVWKQALRKGIEECLLPLYTDTRDILDQKLNAIPIHDAVARDKAREEHEQAYKNICHIAETLYREETESERQQRRWLMGQTVDPDWWEGIVRYQKAIMEKNKSATRESSVFARDTTMTFL